MASPTASPEPVDLETDIWQGELPTPARVDNLARSLSRMAVLEQFASRPEWVFEETGMKWWHSQLEKLVTGLRALADPRTGLLSTGTSPEHGWGIPKRAEFARTVEGESLSGADAAASWQVAIASIADRGECPQYDGLRIGPQLGLLPLGRNLHSGLWEFAHLQTGEPARPGADGKLVLKEETGLVFVLLPGGTFQMGAQKADPNGPNYDVQAVDNEGPVHAVTVSAFFLSKYEMTQGQWERFAGNNPSWAKPGWTWGGKRTTLLSPVEQVSWLDCTEVMDRLGLSLPSEAQWEYGARAETKTVWWTGSERESLQGAANLADQAAARAGSPWSVTELDDGYPSHAPVDAFRPNAFGLHSVHGNVAEWCMDGYDRDFYRKPASRDPVSPAEGSSDRVNRGGNFTSTYLLARSAFRNHLTPSFSYYSFGLRPAKTITP